MTSRGHPGQARYKVKGQLEQKKTEDRNNGVVTVGSIPSVLYSNSTPLSSK